MSDIPRPDWMPAEPGHEAIDAAMEALFPQMRRRFLKSRHLNGSEHWVRSAVTDDLMLELRTRQNLLRQFFDLRMYLEFVRREPRSVTEGARTRIIPGDSTTIDVPAGVTYASIDALQEEHRDTIARRLVAGEWGLLQADLAALDERDADKDSITHFMELAAADLRRVLDEIRRGELLAAAKERRFPKE